MVAMLAGALWQPMIAAVVAVAHLIVATAVRALHLWMARRARRWLQRTPEPWVLSRKVDDEPFVSIHVPACSEPPEVLIRTLESLACLDHVRFEVLVIDNNTADPALWRPVARACLRLGPRFRFFHFDRVEGAKAGALTLALERSHPDTELVMVVDADYEIAPSIMRRALAYLDGGADYVQFPQAYRNVAGSAAGLFVDYARHFDVFMPAADECGVPLLTGTLCVLRREALCNAGGWRSDSITEDAELGTRLILAGARGRYAPEVQGRGLVPTGLRELRKQRRRWILGNAQTLRSLWPRLRQLPRHQALPLLAQLTSWFGFLALPCLLFLVMAALEPGALPWRIAGIAAALTVAVELGAQLAWPSLMSPRLAPRDARFASSVARLGTSWDSATAWMRGLTGAAFGFERTDKSGARGPSTRAAAPQLVTAVLLAVAAWRLAGAGQPIAAMGSAAAAASFGCVLGLRAQLAAVPADGPSTFSQLVTPPQPEGRTCNDQQSTSRFPLTTGPTACPGPSTRRWDRATIDAR